ncbi:MULTISPECIES: hypothetical protein [Francisella]|uniref:Uncharacterized protein n=1 Tax=Francisella opportunistica TaxID=2016517 RepID=A0A345JR84_9GAMM|nr:MULTISPECIES: hypothetical protein [Francisella]APC91550.1 hypothetical protein BBG19_0814 [Francisella sp. MA067296]AXH29830.1 hypothetical protein CGC43_04145 [Francisella opportunistica]AXH31479.1 hypothetical protein CGC44_04105 [Francisella opportunistica]AXH33125.1 hypothetical protein CGC45_04125 [Francisella opportunistica]
MKKLLLAIILAIPVMGYCGFIDWLTGYPEVREKIEKRLEEKYPGDKFEVWDVSYSSNLGGYNFKAKDLSYKDLESGGSYYEKSNKVVDNFGQYKQNLDWKALFKPYVDSVSTNNLIVPNIDGANEVGWQEKQQKDHKPDNMMKTWELLAKPNLTMKEKIAKGHNYIRTEATIHVNAPKTAEGMLKVLEMIENINNYFRSLKLYSYKLEVTVYDLPKGLTFDKYIDDTVDKDVDYSMLKFTNDGDIQKYAWGWLRLYGCEKNSIEKYCNTYKVYKNRVETDQLDTKLINQRTSADRIHNLADIARQFHLYKDPGKETMWHQYKHKGKDVFMYTWRGQNMVYTPLIDTQLYKQILQLENK